jgi:hypothetical protein
MKVLTSLMLATALLLAQDAPQPAKAERLEAVIIPVKTLTGDSFDRLVRLLGVFGARFTADSKLRTIIVYAPKDTVAEMRKVIEELDKPGSLAALGRNIDLTLSFLRCSTKEGGASGSLPADLESVAKQLRAATQYKSVELWDTLPLRLQEGRRSEQSSRLSGSLPGIQGAFASVQVEVLPEGVGVKDQGRYVRFGDLRIKFNIPYMTGAGQYQFSNMGLQTAGDFMENQKTVVGKLSGTDDDTAVFAVISLKILD